MAQVQPLHPTSGERAAAGVRRRERPVTSIVRCELCGEALPESSRRFRLVSPQRCKSPIVVCHTCRSAALGEGYRPVD